MSDLLSKIDAALQPLVTKVCDYIEGTPVEELVCFYDADWGGFPAQAILNKIFLATQGNIPRTHHITYEHTAPAIRWAAKQSYSEVFFVDYEPHQELAELRKTADNVGIFGHHKGRQDIEELSQTDDSFVYFNPRAMLPDKIRYANYRGQTKEYERGVPIAYVFMKAAAQLSVYAELVSLLGIRGYGFQKLWTELTGLSGPHEKSDKVIGDISLLASHRLANSEQILAALTQTTNYTDLKAISLAVSRQRLAEQKNKAISHAIQNSKVLGDIQLFPINSDFQIIKTFVSDLNQLRAKSEGLRTTVCIRPGSRPKASIRTDKTIDLAQLLEITYAELPPKFERNWGAHEHAGGFIATRTQFLVILEAFLNNYFLATEQPLTVQKDELEFLLDKTF